MDKTVRVVLADDHEMFRAGLRRLLEAEPGVQIVGEAADGNAAVQLVDQVLPDVIVMDLSMPGMDGIAATRQILGKSASRSTKVIALSSLSDVQRCSAMLEAGAVAYVVKHSAFEELITALREVVAGRSYVSPGVDQAPPAIVPPLHDPSLSPRERETLRYLLEGDSVKQVAQKLDLSKHTVHLYVTALYRRFEVHSRAELLAKVLGNPGDSWTRSDVSRAANRPFEQPE
jgi:DNA-binding NarL/FixJ family response regulator